MAIKITFELSFNNLDANKFSSIVNEKYNAVLLIEDDKITVEFNYTHSIVNEFEMSNMFDAIWTTFGEHAKSNNVLNYDNTTADVFFDNAQLVHLNHKLLIGQIIFELDFVRVETEQAAEQEDIHTTFYLNENGFEAISFFYGIMSNKAKGEFKFERMRYFLSSFKIANLTFKPTMKFVNTYESKSSTSVKIDKIPTIAFYYESYDENIYKYIDLICTLLSFYFQNGIDYKCGVIQTDKKHIYIKNHKRSLTKKNNPGLIHLGFPYTVDRYLDKIDYSSSIKHHKTLINVVKKYYQSSLLENNTRYLILYGIIEIIMGISKKSFTSTQTPFKLIVSKNAKTKKYKEAFEILKSTVDPNEHSDFMKKWEKAQGTLKYKPMTGPIESFLENNGLNTDMFPISLQRIIEIRNDLTHGSQNTISHRELDGAISFLYKLTGILILNLIGIDDWKDEINTTFKIEAL